MKSWLFKSVSNEMRRRGLSFSVEPLKHGNKNKNERVRILGPAYAPGRIVWPEGDMPRMTRQYLTEKDGAKNYDFKEEHKDEYRKFPAKRAELLDSEAYTEQMMQPDPMKIIDVAKSTNGPRNPAAYRRVTEDERSDTGRYMPRGLAAADRMVRSGGTYGRAMPRGD